MDNHFYQRYDSQCYGEWYCPRCGSNRIAFPEGYQPYCGTCAWAASVNGGRVVHTSETRDMDGLTPEGFPILEMVGGKS